MLFHDPRLDLSDEEGDCLGDRPAGATLVKNSGARKAEKEMIVRWRRGWDSNPR